MTQQVAQLISACQWSPSQFLVISANVFDPLIYYSHFLPLVTALVLGVFVVLRGKGQLATKVLAWTLGFLCVWLFSDMVLWASDNPSLIMFFWTLEIIFEPLVYAGILYFLYLFVTEKDISFNKKIVIFCLLLPTILFASTRFGLLGFDITSCDRSAVEGPLTDYGYFIEIIFILWGLSFAIKSFFQKKTKEDRKKIVLVSIGALGFLAAFSFGNIIGSLFSNSNLLGDYSWSIGQYGIFGVPIFIAFLAYLIVKYRSLNIKTFGAQILVVALIILIGSELFFVATLMNQILVLITLLLACIGGFLLVKSVQNEIKAKEDLEVANAGQTNLIHIINHQIKGYLAKGRNVFAELIEEPSYGITAAAKPMVQAGFDALTEGVDFVQQVLTGSSAEKGTLQYNMTPFDFKELVIETAAKQKDRSDAKHLSYQVVTDAADYTIIGDATQLKEAVRNLIDNSIIYTPSGTVTVTLARSQADKILFSVKDTGLGISDADKARLFTTGGRGKDSIKVNANSTGYGLAFVKGVVVAHKGRVWAESGGPGKGSQFYMELPSGEVKN